MGGDGAQQRQVRRGGKHQKKKEYCTRKKKTLSRMPSPNLPVGRKEERKDRTTFKGWWEIQQKNETPSNRIVHSPEEKTGAANHGC